MTIREFIHGELIDIVEWLETSTDAMAWRFARPNNEIKNGAQLIVRPGQQAVFVEQGTVADVFEPGRHVLATQNLPVLSRLRGWRYGFESPFKADVVFVSTRQLTGQKWGTKTPIMTTDPSLGPVRLRAYGSYVSRVSDADAFVRELVGAHATFNIDQISSQLRDLVVARFSDVLGEQRTSILELASQYDELAARTAARLVSELGNFGLELTQLVVESIGLPDEVAATLDQRTRIGLIGDVSAYAQLQAADAMRDAARNPGGGAASAGMGLGVGVAMGQHLASAAGAALHASAVGATAPASGPPPLPPTAHFFIAVSGAPQGPLDLATLKQRVGEGLLTASTLVWRDGMSQWAAAATIPEVAALL